MVLSQMPWLDYCGHLLTLAEKAGYMMILATAAGIYAAYRLVYAFCLSPFRRIPGPFLARLTSRRAEYFGAIGAQTRKALEDYEAYGDIYMYKPDTVSISNPRDIRTVLGSHSFPKSSYYINHDILGTQTTGSARDVGLAKMRRRQISPYFSNTYLAKMEEAILEHGILAIKKKWDGLLEASGSGQVELNYNKFFVYATYDTIGSLAFGREFGSMRNDDPTPSDWLKATFKYTGLRVLFPLLRTFPCSLLLSRLKKLNQDFISHGASCIATRRELLASLETEGRLHEKPNDLLQAFLDCVDPESKTRMSPTEVHAECIIVLIGGTETSSNTLTWTTHLLMLYPDCYRRAVEEVRSAFEKDHVITYSEAKARLPYVEACIYEALRLIPVAGAQLPRLVPKEGVTLSGHFIPGGSEVFVNMNGANYNRNHWQDPHLYDPTRFLGNEEAKRNIFTFSYGVRVCPGRLLAWIEMLTILANVLKDYDLRLPDEYALRGPTTLDENGHPRLMDSKYYVARTPVDPERDCRAVISKCRQEEPL
ncbi:hypothetical protein GGI12_001669 [Dipsacomyces acuminosporus]|nr:hypothetical protein GGI12_001669 [Dipsacomyces acuminosporus]